MNAPILSKGYILTGGNLFHHKNAEVAAGIVRFTTGPEYLVLVRGPEDLCNLAAWLAEKKMFFRLIPTRSLKEGNGYFSVMIRIPLKKDIAVVEAAIRERPSVSKFVDATKY
jgi:hypothetical protein